MNLYFTVFVVKHVGFEVILKLVEVVAVVVVVEHTFTSFIVMLELLCECMAGWRWVHVNT